MLVYYIVDFLYMIVSMNIFSNTDNSIYWTNPDSNFNFTNTMPLVNRYNPTPMPLGVTSVNMGIGDFNPIGYGNMGFMGVPVWAGGFWGI
jgi:hypothetical protein